VVVVELLEPVAPTAAPVPPVVPTALPVAAVGLPMSVLLVVGLPMAGVVGVIAAGAGMLLLLGVVLVSVGVSVLGLQATRHSVPATIKARAVPRVRELAFIRKLLGLVVCGL
jgi:hypothetical protein